MKVFALTISFLCTLLGFLYIIIGDPKWNIFVAYFFIASFAAFLVLLLTLFGVFLFRTEPQATDGRYLLLILSMLLSLGSGFLYFKENNTTNRLGLVLLIAALSIAVITIIATLFSWVKTTNDSNETEDYLVTTVSAQLVRLGNHRYEYDVVKTIQSRVPIFKRIDIKFKWSGDDVDPNVVKATSKTHIAHKVTVITEDMDYVRLDFKHPIYLKQTDTCHLHLTGLTDLNTPAKPYIAQTVKSSEQISFIRLLAVLKDVRSGYAKKAVAQYRKADAPEGVKYTEIQKVDFDFTTKSYLYDVPEPEPGYEYRIYWGDE